MRKIRMQCVMNALSIWVAYRYLYYIPIITVSVFLFPWIISSSWRQDGWSMGRSESCTLRTENWRKSYSRSRGRCHNRCTPHIRTQRYCAVLSNTEAAVFAKCYFWLCFWTSIACTWELRGNARSRHEREPKLATWSQIFIQSVVIKPSLRFYVLLTVHLDISM